MPEKFYIADCHFYHNNVINLDGRPFADMNEMIEQMVKRWNAKVSPNSEVYILGDFSWGTVENTKKLLEQLNGRKYLIVGNHDYYLKDNSIQGYFEWVKDYAEISDKGRRVVMSHYPILFYNKQWRGAYMLHGHIHCTKDQDKLDACIKMIQDNWDDGEPFNLINCFCGYSDYTPLTLKEWQNKLTKKN